MTGTPLVFEVDGSDERIELHDFRAFVAGYTGRDAASVQHHIDELAAIGVAPPPEVPMYYEMSPTQFSTAGAFTHAGLTLWSGEVEPLYIRHHGRYYLGIGSDHTDRDLEVVDIADSKRACPKPIGSRVRGIHDILQLTLDPVIAECRIDGRAYQRGTLDGIRHPRDVIGTLLERIDLGDGDFVCLGGTLPLLAGTFTDGERWELSLSFADGAALHHHYTTTKGTRQ